MRHPTGLEPDAAGQRESSRVESSRIESNRIEKGLESARFLGSIQLFAIHRSTHLILFRNTAYAVYRSVRFSRVAANGKREILLARRPLATTRIFNSGTRSLARTDNERDAKTLADRRSGVDRAWIYDGGSDKDHADRYSPLVSHERFFSAPRDCRPIAANTPRREETCPTKFLFD